jgi:GR25 family glycosyltransferase involved in LPS biosynthesis
MSTLTQLFENQIYCISCREDRYQKAVEEFKKIGLSTDKIQFYRPKKDPKGGIYGCYESHRQCMYLFWKHVQNKKKCSPTVTRNKNRIYNTDQLGREIQYSDKTLEQQDEYAFISEDDLAFHEEWEERLKALIPLMKSNRWDIINLTNKSCLEAENNGIWHRGPGVRTLAYIVSIRYLEQFSGLLPPSDGLHIDNSMYMNWKSPLYSNRVYFVHKPICYIKDLRSDIRHGVYAKIEGLFGEELFDYILIGIVRRIDSIMRFFNLGYLMTSICNKLSESI